MAGGKEMAGSATGGMTSSKIRISNFGFRWIKVWAFHHSCGEREVVRGERPFRERRPGEALRRNRNRGLDWAPAPEMQATPFPSHPLAQAWVLFPTGSGPLCHHTWNG